MAAMRTRAASPSKIPAPGCRLRGRYLSSVPVLLLPPNQYAWNLLTGCPVAICT